MRAALPGTVVTFDSPRDSVNINSLKYSVITYPSKLKRLSCYNIKMKTSEYFSPVSRGILICAAIFIIIAGMRAASSIISPFLMAAFIAIVCSVPLFWLQKKGISTWLALVIIIAMLGLLGFLMMSAIGSSVEDFSRSVPRLRSQLSHALTKVVSMVNRTGFPLDLSELMKSIDTKTLILPLNYILGGLSGILGSFLIVFLTVLFMLTEASTLPHKLNIMLSNPEESLQKLKLFIEKVIHYLTLKGLVSLITAIAVAVLLWILNIDYIFLWAFLTFFLNFIPYIGSVLAAVPVILLSLIENGPATASYVICGYAAINIVIGNLLEARWLGDSLNLSPLVVFFSLIFWGWILGPIGMFLSVPLTMLIVIALESYQGSQPIARLLSR